MRLKIDWVSLYWEGNLPFLLCFTLYTRANSKYKPPGGVLTEVFLRYDFGVLIFEGAYTWRGLFSQFYRILGLEQWYFSLIQKGLGRVSRTF